MNNLKEYVTDICKEQYGFSDEDTETVVNTVLEYAEGKGHMSMNEVDIYMDGLFTNLDINTGEI